MFSRLKLFFSPEDPVPSKGPMSLKVLFSHLPNIFPALLFNKVPLSQRSNNLALTFMMFSGTALEPRNIPKGPEFPVHLHFVGPANTGPAHDHAIHPS